MKEYRVNQTFNAPDINSSGGSVAKKLFTEGDNVFGVEKPKEKGMIPSVIVGGKYLIPLTYVSALEESDRTLETSVDDTIQDSVKSISDQKAVDGIKDRITGKAKVVVKAKASSYKTGSVIGATTGVLGALYFKKKWWVWGGIGLLVGGYVGHRISQAKKDALNHKVRVIK